MPQGDKMNWIKLNRKYYNLALAQYIAPVEGKYASDEWFGRIVFAVENTQNETRELCLTKCEYERLEQVIKFFGVLVE